MGTLQSASLLQTTAGSIRQTTEFIFFMTAACEGELFMLVCEKEKWESG